MWRQRTALLNELALEDGFVMLDRGTISRADHQNTCFIMKNIKQFFNDTSTPSVASSNHGRHARAVALAAMLGDDPDALKGKKKSVCRLLGISHNGRTIKRAMSFAFQNGPECFAKYKASARLQSNNHLSQDVIDAVAAYYESKGRTNPGKSAKDMARHRYMNEENEEIVLSHSKQYLPAGMSSTEFFIAFKKQHQDFKIGQRSFDGLKPWWWRTASKNDRRTCQCDKCMRAKILVDAIGRLRQKNRIKTPSAPEPVFSVSKITNATVCPPCDEGEHHKEACIDGTCVMCRGREAYEMNDEEVNSNVKQSYNIYEKVSYDPKLFDKEGTEKKKLKYVQKEETMSNLVEKANLYMPKYIEHRARANWQGEQASLAESHMIDKDPAAGHVFLNLDWAERGALLVNDEVQSAYWSSEAYGLLVIIQLRHKVASPNPNSNDL